jgi:hypothetical protein
MSAFPSTAEMVGDRSRSAASSRARNRFKGALSNCRDRQHGSGHWSVDVRYGAHYGLMSDIARGPSWAITGLMRCSKQRAIYYSITSSICASSERESAKPSACRNPEFDAYHALH